MASYSYNLSDNNNVCHYILPNEKDYGVQSIIIRNCISVAECFKIHAHIVDQLFFDRPSEPKDVVYMQVTGPGKAFDSYDKEKHKLPITLKAYIQLLNFFYTDYHLVLKRIDADYHVMKAGKEWLSLFPTVTFQGPADIIYKCPLDSCKTFGLDLTVTRRVDIGKTSVTLKYTKEDMGMIYIQPPAMLYLAQDRDFIASLLNYKGGSTPKRSRQS